MRARVAFFAAVVATGLLAAPARAAAPSNPYNLKPDARGKACQSCHPDFGEVLRRSSVHTPVRAGDCSSCHNPHASDHGKLLGEGPGTICRSCHAGIVPESAVSVHAVLADGGCVGCHDPHASAQKSQLVAVESTLCVTCHQAVGSSASSSRFKHPPVADGCRTCHDPHASTSAPSLLRAEEKTLCSRCHDPKQARFSTAHAGYPVSAGRCTSCHDPHGSNQPAMLWEHVHAPVASKSCALCHQDASSPNPLGMKKAGVDTCRGCHATEVNGILTSPVKHWPALSGRACLNCHGPHATREPGLLMGTEAEVCGTCHESTLRRQAAGASKHQPNVEGLCTACHSPHAAQGALLLAGNPTETCGGCHDWTAHTAHPLGEKARDPRNPNLAVDCRSCHRMHGTPFKYLAPFDPRKDLCVQCHAELGR